MSEILKENSKKIISYIAILLFSCFLFSRARYGYIYNDEPFILTLAHRLLKGDALLCDEWHPTQLTGYLNYFITKVYFMFHSSTEGMILNFRYIYVVLWTLTILVIYRRISKYTKKPIITCFACLYLLLFSSMDIMTLSYNFYSLAGVMLCYTFVVTGNKKWEYFLSGIFYSIATLASPYLSIVFILYYIGYGIYKWILKKEINNKWKEVTLYLLYGVLVSVVLFVIFFFRHGGSIDKAIQTLHYVFTDNQYPNKSFAWTILGFLGTAYFKFYLFAFILIGTYLIGKIFKRKDIRWFEVHCALFVLLMPWMRNNYRYYYYFNKQIVQMCFLGFHALIINKNRNKTFTVLYFVGFLFGFVLYATSDLQAIATSIGLCVSGFASFFLIYDCLNQYEINNIIKWLCCFGVMIAQINCQVKLRNSKYYWDFDISHNTYEINNSIAKGIYVTESEYNEYESIYDNLKKYIPEHSKLCCLSKKPLIFLMNDSEYNTYSAWISGSKDYKIRRMKAYYKSHLDKMPDYVYVTKDDFDEDYLNEVFIGYEVNECDDAYILKRD